MFSINLSELSQGTIFNIRKNLHVGIAENIQAENFQNFALELKGITKNFPGIIANENVEFTLREGEIHTILGENGAGKSTLMNIIAGLYPADAGEIKVFGEMVNFTNPRQAIEKSIGMVFQHFMLVRNHTVAENIILGMPGVAALELKKVHQQIREISERYDLFVDPEKFV